MFENYDDVLTVEEACEALKIGYNAMYELLNTGKLKGYRNGRVPCCVAKENPEGWAERYSTGSR